MDTTSAWEKSAAHHADGVKAYTACPSVRSSGSLLGHLILIHGLRLESIRLGPAHFDSKELLQHFCFGLPQGANGLQDLLTVHARRQTNTHTHTPEQITHPIDAGRITWHPSCVSSRAAGWPAYHEGFQLHRLPNPAKHTLTSTELQNLNLHPLNTTTTSHATSPARFACHLDAAHLGGAHTYRKCAPMQPRHKGLASVKISCVYV